MQLRSSGLSLAWGRAETPMRRGRSKSPGRLRVQLVGAARPRRRWSGATGPRSAAPQSSQKRVDSSANAAQAGGKKRPGIACGRALPQGPVRMAVSSIQERGWDKIVTAVAPHVHAQSPQHRCPTVPGSPPQRLRMGLARRPTLCSLASPRKPLATVRIDVPWCALVQASEGFWEQRAFRGSR